MGRVYRNVDDLVEPQPTVVVTGSWLTVKEQMPHTYAVRLAELGVTAFTFDFTGFGQSGGAPRQVELPARKIAGITFQLAYQDGNLRLPGIARARAATGQGRAGRGAFGAGPPARRGWR